MIEEILTLNLDATFEWVTVQDVTALTPGVARSLRLRLVKNEN